jgi:magnesium transporter
MNVPNGFEESPYAFFIVAVLSLAIAILVGMVFLRKKLFR